MLTIDNLSAVREDIEILDKVTLSIRPASTTLLMGPNGSGKTSLARVIVGDPSYRLTGGSMKLGYGSKTEDLLPLSSHERARRGLFVSFQLPIELPGVSTYEFLFASYKAVHPDEVKDLEVDEMDSMIDAAAEKLGIPEGILMRGVNDGFSGGERKKLELLQMVVLRPRDVILDEPDSGLDADSVKLIRKALGLIEKNAGVLIISHDAPRLGDIHFDAVSIMREGTISEQGGMELIERVSRQGYD